MTMVMTRRSLVVVVIGTYLSQARSFPAYSKSYPWIVINKNLVIDLHARTSSCVHGSVAWLFLKCMFVVVLLLSSRRRFVFFCILAHPLAMGGRCPPGIHAAASQSFLGAPYQLAHVAAIYDQCNVIANPTPDHH